MCYSMYYYVVVQFYPWFKFSFLLFLGMVMYDNNMIMSLKQKKKFEPRIKLNHNIYIILIEIIILLYFNIIISTWMNKKYYVAFDRFKKKLLRK